jgi:hypothetical protein
VDLWGSGGVSLLLSLSVRAPQRQLSSDAVSAVAGCDLLVSKVRTWPVREVTLSALLTGALCLTVVAAAVESAAVSAHSGAAPPDSVHSLRSVYPSVADPVYRVLTQNVHLAPNTQQAEQAGFTRAKNHETCQ